MKIKFKNHINRRNRLVAFPVFKRPSVADLRTSLEHIYMSFCKNRRAPRLLIPESATDLAIEF